MPAKRSTHEVLEFAEIWTPTSLPANVPRRVNEGWNAVVAMVHAFDDSILASHPRGNRSIRPPSRLPFVMPMFQW
jgi:hypothetical protein